jgi:sucrose-6F-phosphate phosphohydrolase
MGEKILVCTDLDRTLIANGPEPESVGARARFQALVARPEVMLVYVSGRHRKLVNHAIKNYRLPSPDYVVANVGTTIYQAGSRDRWRQLDDWEAEISVDWSGKSGKELMEVLHGLPQLRPQERAKQNRLKLSYYLPVEFDHEGMAKQIHQRLESLGVNARLIWSIDDPAGVGLLDILPARASKFHALEYLMQETGFNLTNTLFCGDSGNDLEVLISSIPSVLVANASMEIKAQARELADLNGHGANLYIAAGGLFGMNGCYSAGMLEGIAHYHPHTLEWMALPENRKNPTTSGRPG